MIVVTGASGLLGANLVLTLLDAGEKVAAVCRSNRFEPPGVQAVAADLANECEVRRCFESRPVSWVVHCAAATSVDLCERNPDEAWHQNVHMSRCVAQAVWTSGARMVYISSDSVYDGNHGLHTETEIPAPCNVYARTKLEGETVVQDLLGDSALVLRTTMYGWNAQPKQSLSEWILAKLENGESVPGFLDVIFSPLPVNWLALTIHELMLRNAIGTYNVGGSGYCSKFAFAAAVAEVFGQDVSLVQPTRVGESPLGAPRPRDTSLNCSKLTALLGNKPPGLYEGLRHAKLLRESGFAQRLRASLKVAANANN